MAQAFRIETLDRSGRWYLTPGAGSVYDLRVRNDSKNAAECSLVVEEPVSGVSVEPSAFSLRGHEVRTVTVTFAPEATAARAHQVLLSLRSDEDGSVLATFEHPLVVTGGTDCSVAVAWKDVIIEAGELRGFQVACSVRSQSEATSTFQVSLSPHPAFSIPPLPPISLEPGQLGEMIIPIQWNRDAKDEGGWNHPLMIEVAVPVSNGRRTSRMRWESIELQLDPFLKKNGAPTMSVTVSSGLQAQAPESAATAPAHVPAASQVSAPPQVSAAVLQAPVAPTPVTLPIAPVAPAAAAASAAPAVESARTVEPARVEPTNVPTSRPATAAEPASVAAAKPAPKQAQPSKATAVATAAPAVLMLNGHTQLLMLAAPADTKLAAASTEKLTPANGRADVVKPAAPVASAAPTTDPIELSLFPGIVATGATPTAPAVNGKHEAVPQASPAATQASPHAAPVKPAQGAQPAPPPTPPAPAAASAQPAAPPQAVQPATPPAGQPKTVPTVTWTVKSATMEEPFSKVVPTITRAAAAPAPAAPTPAAAAASPTVAPAPAASAGVASEPAAHMVSQPTSLHTPTLPTPAVPPAKLTPYAPARWDGASMDAAPAPRVAPKPTESVDAPATEPQTARVIRERLAVEPQRRSRPMPAGLLIGGLAGIALLVAGVLIFKPSTPSPSGSSIPVAAQPQVAAPTVQVQQQVATMVHPAATHRTVKPKLVAAAPSPQATAPTQTPKPATPKPQTPKPSTPAPATPRPAAQKVVAVRPAAKPISHYATLYQPASGPVVALGSVEAYYGPRGRAVRVLWGAAEQASATVELIDDHGTTVGATSVRGARSSALLYLPRGFRGSLTVQVSSVGRMGERVATTTSLAPFGR